DVGVRGMRAAGRASARGPPPDRVPGDRAAPPPPPERAADGRGPGPHAEPLRGSDVVEWAPRGARVLAGPRDARRRPAPALDRDAPPMTSPVQVLAIVVSVVLLLLVLDLVRRR